jgi:hypothetical protein
LRRTASESRTPTQANATNLSAATLVPSRRTAPTTSRARAATPGRKQDRKVTLKWHVDASRRRLLERTRLGRRVLCTDRNIWSTGRIVHAFRGQWNVEELFRRAKKGGVVPWGPSHQWADGSLRLHTFATVIGLMLVGLARIAYGSEKSAQGMMKMLSGIKATAAQVHTKQRGRRATVLLAPDLTGLFAATANALSGPGSRGAGSARPTGAARRSALDGRKMPARAAAGMPGRGSESFKLGVRPMARAPASAASGPFTAALTVLFNRSVTAWLTGRAFGPPRETIS